MDIGSHTKTHCILKKLSKEEQLAELRQSKMILEKKLNIDIKAIAYPVGHNNAYDSNTFEAVKESGYKIAFAYEGGLNMPFKTKIYEVKRIFTENLTPNIFSLKINMGLAFGDRLSKYFL